MKNVLKVITLTRTNVHIGIYRCVRVELPASKVERRVATHFSSYPLEQVTCHGDIRFPT